MSPMRKVAMRRARARESALSLLRELSAGNNHYDSYRVLYLLWCGNNAAVRELKPLLRISGVYPDGPLSVNEEFRKTVLKVATEILPGFADAKPEDR
jgi:hypothetical protein